MSFGSVGIGGEVIEPGRDRRLAAVAVDQRRAERSVGMGPAHQHGHLQAVAAALDRDREEADEPRGTARRHTRPASTSRPNTGADAAMNDGLVERVGRERPRR